MGGGNEKRDILFSRDNVQRRHELKYGRFLFISNQMKVHKICLYFHK